MSFRWSSSVRRSLRQSSSRPKARRMVPAFELLEDRCLLSNGGGTGGPAPVGTAPPYVAGLYFDILDRAASQTELNNWGSLIAQGATANNVAQSFLGSAEFLQNQAQALYKSLYGRSPNQATLASLTKELQTDGGNIQQVTFEQVSSANYFQNYAGSNGSTWVSDIYQSVLGRPADSQGLANWNGQLANNASLQAVAAALVYSPEALALEVDNSYHLLLGRDPDTGGISFWSTALQNGMTENQLDAQLAASAEYSKLYANSSLPTSNQLAVNPPGNLTAATLQATNYYETATPAFTFATNLPTAVAGRAWIQLNTNGSSSFTGNQLYQASAIFSTNNMTVTMQPVPEGTYTIRGEIKTITGQIVTTPVVTITVDPNAGFIGSQPVLQMMSDYKSAIQKGTYNQANFDAAHSVLRFDSQGRVQIDVHATLPQYLTALEASLQAQGMQVQGVYTSQTMVQGYYPVAGLSTLASTPHFEDLVPISPPVTYTGSVESQGDAVVLGPQFRKSTGNGGQGILVGVLSDSANETTGGGGVAGGISSGNLPADYKVLEDFPGGADEGRAMSEIVYDVAPGVSGIDFHTADVSQQDFAAGIEQLASMGAQVITDDVGYTDDPMFNDGVISQAVDQVASQGVFYDASAGNTGTMGNIYSWTSTTATVGSTSGTFLKLPNGTALLPFTLAQGDDIWPDVQWSDAFLEGGSNLPNYQVKTEVDLLITNAAGTQVFADVNNNTLNTNEANQFAQLTNSFGTTNLAMAFYLAARASSRCPTLGEL